MNLLIHPSTITLKIIRNTFEEVKTTLEEKGFLSFLGYIIQFMARLLVAYDADYYIYKIPT